MTSGPIDQIPGIPKSEKNEQINKVLSSYPTQVNWDILLRNTIRKGTMGFHIVKLSGCKDDWILMVFICEAMVGLKGAPKSTNIYQKHGFL